MATYIDPVEASVREVLHDISYFEGYDLPASPPETPPMKSQAQMLSVHERTPMHVSLEKMFPRTPPQSPRHGLKRKFSNNMRSAFASVLPATPPASPPTRMGLHTALTRTMSDSVNKAHQISIFAVKSRPTIVTIDVSDASPARRSSLRRSSSYSLDSADSGSSRSRDPLDRIRDYSARSTDARYPSESPSAPPSYSPPPNTPANAYAPVSRTPGSGVEYSGMTQRGSQAGGRQDDPFNPFAYTGPTQYPNHSQRAPTQPSNGLWQAKYPVQYPNLPSPSKFETPNASVVDLEKARGGHGAEYPKKKRHCKRAALICCLVAAILVLAGVAAAVVIVIKLRHHHRHHKRMDCIDVPGMFMNGEWEEGFKKCT